MGNWMLLGRADLCLAAPRELETTQHAPMSDAVGALPTCRPTC